jgi:hypothetical protein
MADQPTCHDTWSVDEVRRWWCDGLYVAPLDAVCEPGPTWHGNCSTFGLWVRLPPPAQGRSTYCYDCGRALDAQGCDCPAPMGVPC